jgi:Tol biopolymer transport system component
MYKIALFLNLLIAVLICSCKKEYSCEGCINSDNPPIAIAGLDQLINLPTDSILLDGTSSYDPDGTIKGWVWKKVSGPAAFNINNAAVSKTEVKNLEKGIYQFELKVTDDKGLSATDTVQVTVIEPGQPNRSPIANAGPDQTITLPINTVTLDGRGSSDPDNNITAYVWTKISGPSSFNISNTNAVQTQATNLIEGVYQFELKVTDGGGLFSKDTVQVQVVSQPLPLVCTDCKIVFVSTRDGNAEIYSCNVDGSNIQRLTNNAGTDDQPAWSPDGTHIAFISDRTGNAELYIMNADGSNLVRKTFSGSYSQHPAWSPDGTTIAYSTQSNGSQNIWVVSAVSGSPLLLFEAPGLDEHPTWSPDGKKIALVSDWAAYDFVYDIYTINADGTGFTALTGNIYDNIDYLNPSWSPGGSKLAMAIRQTTGINQYNTQVGIMNADGSGITVIRSGVATGTKTSWSGDGTKIAYTSLFGSRMDVSWVSADGSLGETIVTNGWNADWQH